MKYIMDEPWKYLPKPKKPVVKNNILYDACYVKCSESANLYRQKTDWWLPSIGRKGEKKVQRKKESDE